MRALLGTACFALAFLASAISWAATVQPVQGDVSINQGQGFAPVNGRVDAQAGDSIMVSPNGAATVAYPDGCQVGVQPGAVVTIAPLSPCASGSMAQESFFSDPGFLIMGAAFVGATGLAVYGMTQAKSTTTTSTAKPASP